MKSLRMTEKERAKVTHDINNVWHKQFKGKYRCRIITRSNEMDSPFYVYYFINYGFDEYVFVGKYAMPEEEKYY